MLIHFFLEKIFSCTKAKTYYSRVSCFQRVSSLITHMCLADRQKQYRLIVAVLCETMAWFYFSGFTNPLHAQFRNRLADDCPSYKLDDDKSE